MTTVLPGLLLAALANATPGPALLPAFRFDNAARPVLPPVNGSVYDSTVCMNPYIIKVADGSGAQWRLFYAGSDGSGTHRIALATAPVTGPTPRGADWTRRGVVLGVGAPGSFNSIWSVLPLVHKFGKTWHLYFTGRSVGCPYEKNATVLQTFCGIGLATSTDGVTFTARKEPVILGNQTREFPHNYGVAGGGTILEERMPGGSIRFRMYYTLAVGGSPGVTVGQRKLCAVAHSADGIVWTNHSIVLGPTTTDTQPREDIACAAPVVFVDAAGIYRMVYSAIGSKWGFYSLAQAASADGYSWVRGAPGTDDDLVLAPNRGNTEAWDHQMVEYASVWRGEEAGVGRTGLFYAGNGYGATGIGYTELGQIPSTGQQ